MTRAVQGALAEWLAALSIGIIPLIAHAVIHFSVTLDGSHPEGSWISDLDFIVISTSGGSLVSIVKRLLEGSLKTQQISKSLIAISAITVLILAAAAILYGAVATGAERGYAIWICLGLVTGSLIVSIYCELTLASRLE